MKLPERREMERFPLEIEDFRMSFENSADYFSEGFQVENICAGGAFIKTETILPVGTDVTLDMVLPLKGVSHFSVKKSHISVIGEVLRTGEKGMAIGFGKKYSITPYAGGSV